MKQFDIYKNYGILTAEKRAVYSVGGTSMTATCYDKLTVEAPAGWEVWESESGELCATAPDGPEWDLLEKIYDSVAAEAEKGIKKESES